MVPLSFPSGNGPAKGRNELLGRSVLGDGLERRISVWGEDVAEIAG